MRILLGILLLAALAFIGWQHSIIGLQAEAIRVDKKYWTTLQDTAPVVGKHLETGDIYVSVPYRDKPIRYKRVCTPELKL